MNDTQQKIDDGGPAFARLDGPPVFHRHGMSTRMWLAGVATEEDVVDFRFTHTDGSKTEMETRVDARFRYADAMIAASK